MGKINNQFQPGTRVMITDCEELTGLTGVTANKPTDSVCSYIVILDEPYDGNIALNIIESCLSVLD